MKNRIKEVLLSFEFREFLERINSNFFNLKQENIIRNYLVESLNQNLLDQNDTIAIGEYPRDGLKRVDLSVITNNGSYLVELKYQFPKDVSVHKCFKDTISHNLFEREINKQKIDLLIIIISEWEKQDFQEYIQKFGISIELAKYQLDNDSWKEELIKNWSSNEFKVESYQVKVGKPFKTNYHFYLIERNQLN